MSAATDDRSRDVTIAVLPARSTPEHASPTHADAIATPSSAAVAPKGGFDRYVLGEELGRGGMGTVWKAWDGDLERAVALKVLHDIISDDARFTGRFVQEARLAARLEHPAIVPVYDVGTTPTGKLYFTMRLIEGRTLGDVVTGERSPAGAQGYTRFQLLQAFREICNAMAYVHQHGIVHRDLKPDNIMLGAYGEVLIMDFGIAKALAAAEEASLQDGAAPTAPSVPPGASVRYRADTVAGAVLGTPAFMAPEQARGDKAVTPLWDIYALGGILHYLLTARAPGHVQTHDAPTTEGGTTEQAPVVVSPRALDVAIPLELEAICKRALAAAPGDRYPTAKALADDVQAFLEQRPVSAFREGRARRAWKWARRRRRALAGVAASLVVVAIAIVASRAASTRAMQSRARAEATAAGADLREARGGDQPRDISAIHARRARLLGLALTAFEAANTASALAPRDVGAQRERFEAALALGEVALEDEQWGLAASAFERAREAHVDDERALRAIQEVEQARTRAEGERQKSVTRIVERARRGALSRDGDYQDALFALVAAGDAATVQTLVDALDQVTTELDSADRQDPQVWPKLAQEREVGPAELRLARLASEALGRIGIVEPAADALERYLDAEADELRAVAPAIALCRLGRASSQAAVTAARDRLGGANGLFWKLVGPDMRRFAAEGPEPTTADAFRSRARLRTAKGDTEGAIADATRATELDPDNPVSWLVRGIAHRRNGDLDGAIADYSRAIAIDPTNAVTQNDRGFAELERGDLDAAIVDFDRSIALRPESARTLTHRATAYRLKGNVRAALAGYDEAIKLDPRFPLAFRGRGDAHVDAKDAVAAIADYDRAIELDPNDAEAWASRAGARLLAGDPGRALADATHAMDLDPKSGLGRLARAHVNRTRGDLEGALADAKGALLLELRPRDQAAARALVAELLRRP